MDIEWDENQTCFRNGTHKHTQRDKKKFDCILCSAKFDWSRYKRCQELSFNIKVFIKNNLSSCLKINFYLSYKAGLCDTQAQID